VKCGGLDFASGDFASLPIRAESSQTVSIPLGETYEITGLQFIKGDVFCPQCITNMINNTESGIKIKKYCDVQCNVCLNKYSRSMGTFSWEGWECATNFSPQAKKFYPGYGSGYDMDVFSIRSENQLRDNWKNIDLSKPFIICDLCLKEGVDKQFLKHKSCY